jgi:hypothetical protein
MSDNMSHPGYYHCSEAVTAALSEHMSNYFHARELLAMADALAAELEAERERRERYETLLAEKDYDPGLLGGENMGSDQQTTWWQDYIRAEIGRCNDYWRELLEEALKGGEE